MNTSASGRARAALAKRPELSPTVFNLLLSAYILVIFNATFWKYLGEIFDDDLFSRLIFAAAIFSLTFFTLSLFTVPRLHRAATVLLVFIAAGASWYQDRLGILIDKYMVQNVMSTTYAESSQLITWPFVRYMVLTAVIPAVVISRVRIRYPRPLHILWRLPLTIVASFLLTFGLLFSNLKANAAAIREHHELMSSYQPGATIAAVVRYAKMELKARNTEMVPIGLDAQKGPLLSASRKPVLLVVFAGETARAQNFGLDGYERDTTPGLARRDIINFPDASSCGTSTAVSLPCMFSPFAADDYSHQAFMGHENLLDVLTHAGVNTLWVDNNTGPQNIANRTDARMVEKTLNPQACETGECTDEALLSELQATLDQIEGDTVLVLHMIGSHGPAYYLRYPQDMARFTPDCRTAELESCSTEEIVNAYDNTIAFTDHVLDSAIAMLEAQDKVVPAMLYASDHGESLGEGGLYLHAAPRFIAPEVQTKVPFLMWMSPAFRTVMALDDSCLAEKATRPVSHDNLFHTVLGLMDIETDERDSTLDLTAGCRGPVNRS